MKASYHPYQLQFKKPILTSRGSMTHKNGYYLCIEDKGIRGIGECSFIEGLSIDRLDQIEGILDQVVVDIVSIEKNYFLYGILPTYLDDFPSVHFGLETALLDVGYGGKDLFSTHSEFSAGTRSIPINGLVWMGSDEFMKQQIEQKLADGFRCIKIKVGAIDFAEECRLIENIRKRYDPREIEIRLDANGAFTEQNVRERLRILSQYTIHSIEQPIRPQQYLLMHDLCAENIIPIALDEELIGIHKNMKQKLLETIRPQYIILKPSLMGGFDACGDWIYKAKEMGIKWWATSALESNIGLNAIAQWLTEITMNDGLDTVQGLGTGGLYINNIESPLYIEAGHLKYDPNGKWGDMIS